jgi:RNA polymerase sigma-70 factor (ECF subfamily)
MDGLAGSLLPGMNTCRKWESHQGHGLALAEPTDYGMTMETTESARERFESIVGDNLDALYGSAVRLTRNRTDAEDLLQETLLKAWRSFHTFELGTNARAWMFRILMNAHIDRHRKMEREPETTDVEDVGDFYLYSKVQESDQLKSLGDPEKIVVEGLMEHEVQSALESLPEHFRSAVILADLQGFSYKEIAAILDVPVGTVMSRLFRGRRILQRKLWDYVRQQNRLRTKPGGAPVGSEAHGL